MSEVLKRTLLLVLLLFMLICGVSCDDVENVSVTEKVSTYDTIAETVSTERVQTESTAVEATTDNSRVVYISVYGERYHYSRKCAGIEVMEISENTASTIYTSCRKCVR